MPTLTPTPTPSPAPTNTPIPTPTPTPTPTPAPNLALTATLTGTGDALLTFTTVPGQTYYLQFCDDLDSGFTTFVTLTAAPNQYSAMEPDVGAASHPDRFYRVMIAP
jgi:hypothetical protein